MQPQSHSVTLDREKCKGCTTCIKHCPTEAIRVRRGKAIIIREKCIDCGQCIRVCPHHAKKAVCDPMDALSFFKYNVALPAPTLYGQFQRLDNVNIVLAALTAIGFDHVFEVSRGAEAVSAITRGLIAEGKLKTPVISSACPACVRLITMRFPQLVSHVCHHIAPVELAAIIARREAVQRTGLAPDDIGVFFITPCPAKVTAAHSPLGLSAPVMDGAVAMGDIYKRLLPAMKKITDPPNLSQSGLMGIGWATSGGESAALLGESYIAVDGIENVISVLEDVDDGRLSDTMFIEVNACTQGCVGGCLTVENPYVAKTRIKRLMKFLPVSRNKMKPEDLRQAEELSRFDKALSYNPVGQFDEDVTRAMQKQAEAIKLRESLPGLDCGSCGAPTCQSLSEDVVMGFATLEDCIFTLRERMQYLSGTGDADDYLPPPFRRVEDE